MTLIPASSVYALPGGIGFARATFVRASSWLAVLIVLAVYVWIVSAGTWLHWPSYGKSYYQDLSDGFRSGQLSLASKPKPELLALKDPYDPATNEGLRIHDVSLYKGRFYLYWGPVPALLLAIANTVGVPKLDGDQYLVFAFAAGSLGFVARLLLRLWQRHFSETVPAWAVPLAILTIGLANPAPFNLARASVYEAAIAAAQFFLLGGIYFAVTAFVNVRASPARLFLAGSMLACAVGSRASLALPVVAIAILVTWRLLRLGKSKFSLRTRDEAAARRVAPATASPGASRLHENVGFTWVMPREDDRWRADARPPRVGPLLVFVLPLLAMAGALGAYNYARFGSVTELGVRYQLAGFNSFKNVQTLVSARNVVPNIYSYALRPPLAKPVFPYVVPRSGLDGGFPRWLPVPPFHVRDDAVAGMLLVTPFVAFAAVTFARRKGGRGLRDDVADDGEEGEHGSRVRWLAVLLAAVVVLSAIPALVLSFSTMRYLADWSLPLLLLAVIGFWRGIANRAGRPWPRRVWMVAGGLLMSVTVLVGPLLGVTGALDQFARHNPALLTRLVEVTYRGPVPGVAQVSGPSGIDLMDQPGGWWLGVEMAAVDVIVPRDGLYDVQLAIAPGTGAAPTTLQVGADPGKPMPVKQKEVMATLPVSPGPSSVRFNARLRAGLNRLFMSTTIPKPADALNGRRLVGIVKVDVRPSADTAAAADGAAVRR